MSEQHTTTVLLVDDHPLIRQGLRTLLDSEANITVVGEAGDGQEAIEQVKILTPDVTIMDISMPNTNGIEATRCILAEAPETRIIALSIHSEKRFVDEMLRAGARAYILKDSVPEELVHAIGSVMRGESFLSTPALGTIVSEYQGPTGDVSGDSTAVERILQTKLHPPSLPPDLVPRSELLERLEAGRVRPLTLVSAPAGFGKSILISSWLTACSDWPSAWFSLDGDDSNLRQFLHYFLAAVQSAYPHACEQTQNLLSTPKLPSLPSLVASLSNDLDAIDQPFILVLDDYHRIDADSPVNDLIHQLLMHPPIPLHLIILTRRDPPLQLSTLRAQGQMTEVRMQDLRFGQDETRALLEAGLEYSIGDEALINLQREMEGWVVGLRLVSLALRTHKNRDVFLQKIHGGLQQTQEYLVQEVIAQQSPLMQDWLMQSAILDRFCESLVQAVCASGARAGAAETDRGKFIESVHAGNLFVIPLDSGGKWFRYHHQFQQLLQHELNRCKTPDEIARLNSRASAWFESQGLVEEAVRHALRAGDVISAAEIVERHKQVELNQHRWYVVERWLAMLPVEIIQQRPGLLLAQMWGLYNTFQLLQMPPLLEQAESLLSDKNLDKTMLGEVNFYRGYLLTVFQGDAKGALTQFKAARKRFSGLQTRIIMGELEIMDAIAHQMVGEGALAIQSLDQKILATDSGEGHFLSRLAAGPVFVHLLSGNLAATIRTANHFISICKNTGFLNSEGTGHCLQANAFLQSYRLDEALLGFQLTIEKRDIVHRKFATDAHVGLVLTYLAMQQPDAAVKAMNQLMEHALDMGEAQHIDVAQSCQARLSLSQGDLKPAIDWAQSYDKAAHVPSMLMWLEIPAITKIRVMVTTGSHEELQQASELLTTICQSAGTLHNTYQSINLLLLQSLALEKLARANEALEVLRQAIKLAKPGGWVRPFVELGRPMAKLLEQLADQKELTDYLHFVLDKFPQDEQQQTGVAAGESRATTSSDVWLAESLTSREFDVLELLAQRLQTKEIAARLFVSSETIKSHLKNLYQKLAVHNRRDAAIKAEELLSQRRDAS